MKRSIHAGFALAVAAGSLCISSPSVADGETRRLASSSSLTAADATDLALGYLTGPALQKDGGAIAAIELRVLSTATSVGGQVTHVYVQQTSDGLDVIGADANVAVDDGRVVAAPSRLFNTATASKPSELSPSLDAANAVVAAATGLGIEAVGQPAVVQGPTGLDRSQTLAAGSLATADIPARLVWFRDGKHLRLAWELSIDLAASPDWWELLVDTATGDILRQVNFTARHNAASGHTADHTSASGIEGVRAGEPTAELLLADNSSYRVFAQPIESPNHGTRSLVTEPADDIASPFGWHDTNGVLGAESTLTTGNNVDAYTDRDGNDNPDPGSRPDGGEDLEFDFPIDFALEPSTYADASVTNLFYWNNVAHDFLYAYGFDEASGNFQTNNYGNGGAGGDAVRAETQDEADLVGKRNNANFATPPDGSRPRMQMFLWDGAPELDGAFDHGIVLHEYAHGLSTRLTGGRTTSACLSGAEQAGEGWSDYVGLMGTMQPDDTRGDRRGIATYSKNEPTDGVGIRSVPYSTDFSIDGRTYDSIRGARIPHGVGSTFAAMLWEMTWDLIDEYGFDPDLARGDGGNNIALQLVVDGLKLQRCDPGFVDARDAILQADTNLTGGANTCLIWGSFARRGLGFSADQGSSASRSDGTEAFDLPAICPLEITKTVRPEVVNAGDIATFTIGITNNSPVTETDIVVSDPLDAALSYISGSATCGGTFPAGEIRFEIPTLAPNASISCSFRARTDPSTAAPSSVIDDGFDPDARSWIASHDPRPDDDPFVTVDWELAPGAGLAGSNAMFATDEPTSSDQYLTLASPFSVPARGEFVFWHRYNLEDNYDGGVVEISIDGGANWIDLGDAMITNGYDRRISADDRSSIQGRLAFTGEQSTFEQTVIDISAWSGSSALIRFRLATDPAVAMTGWWIDAVSVGTSSRVTNTAVVTSASNGLHSDSVRLEVTSTLPPVIPPVVDPPPASSPPWHTITPARLLDSRLTAVRPAGSTTRLVIGGRDGVPVDARAAIVNITAVQPESNGFVTVFPCDVERPVASSLNFTSGVNLGNELIVELDNNGATCLFVSAPTHLTADVVGHIQPGSDYVPVTPARLLDTRPGNPTIDGRYADTGVVAADTQVMIDVHDRAGISPTARSVVVNVTAIRADSNGFASVHACLEGEPTTSSLNYVPDTNRANELVVQVSSTGKLCLLTSQDVHLAVDVVGFVRHGAGLTPIEPARLLDTRDSGATVDRDFLGGGTLAPGAVTRLQVAGRAGIPAGAKTAVLNLTAVQAAAPGFVTVWPCADLRPLTSNLNHIANVNGANQIIAGLENSGPDAGAVCIYNHRRVGIIVDAVAYTGA
jgi:uncharacterized repeat protein (TIGR01451 family)